MMTIVHITTSLKIGGAERALCLLIEQLGNVDYEHHVIYFHPGPFVKTLQALDIKTYHVKGLVYRYDPVMYLRLSALIKKIHPSVIHAQLWTANIVARLLGKQHRIPVVTALHGNCNHEGTFRNYLDRITAHWSNAIIAVAPDVHDAYQKKILTNKKQQTQKPLLITIHNGINPQQMYNQAKKNKVTRADLGFAKDDFIIGSVGRLEPIKGYALLLQAFSLLISRINKAQKITLCIIGDGSEKESLLTLAKKNSVTDSIIFLGAQQNVYSYYRLFDCFAMSSHSEGLSLALLEALCFDLPVVITNNSPQHPVITHGIHGFIAPPNDPLLFSQYLEEIIINKSLFSKVACTTKNQSILTTFAIENTAKNYASLFKTVSLK